MWMWMWMGMGMYPSSRIVIVIIIVIIAIIVFALTVRIRTTTPVTVFTDRTFIIQKKRFCFCLFDLFANREFCHLNKILAVDKAESKKFKFTLKLKLSVLLFLFLFLLSRINRCCYRYLKFAICVRLPASITGQMPSR